jgi:hypothetical protein
MKRNTKSSITLPAGEVRMVEALQARLGAKSKVGVVRRAFVEASRATREATLKELEELDALTAEGLEG